MVNLGPISSAWAHVSNAEQAQASGGVAWEKIDELVHGTNTKRLRVCDMCQASTPKGKPCEYCGRPE